ncbi:MAG: PEP-CTERM sorting domain-containing protein [Bryobacterales bacterium]|nr:PEP-CTERM sorting domain-containing protein [Bryobacterales bacterium]
MRFLFFTGLLHLLPTLHAATVTFSAAGNVMALSGSTATVSATVTISTFQDMVQVEVMNNIVGANRDLKGISAVDFVLSTGQVNATISSQAGLVRTIASNGTWTAGDTAGGRGADFSASQYANEWAVYNGAAQVNGLSGGLSLTTLNGGNPTLTIFGAPNANNRYNTPTNPNSAVTGHNPYLATAGQPVTFNLFVAGVTVDTVILPNTGNVRFFFGTDRSAYLDAHIDNPEPASFALMATGLIGIALLSRWRTARARAHSRR